MAEQVQIFNRYFELYYHLVFKEEEIRKRHPITLNELKGLFNIYAGGMLLSFLGFLVEIFWFRMGLTIVRKSNELKTYIKRN